MNNWAPRLTLEAELQKLDELIKAAPQDITPHFNRAILLTELGRTEEAKDVYLSILAQMPSHFGALNNLGSVLTTLKLPIVARAAYAEGVKRHPDNATAHVNFANLLMKNNETDLAIEHFRIAIELDPNLTQAHQGLSYVLTEKGDEENAIIHRIQGFKDNPIMIFPYRGEGLPVVLLLLGSAMGKAVPVRHHLDEKVFFTSVVFVEFYNESFPFPPHHLVFNVVGDADVGMEALHATAKILEYTTAPVINPPAKVLLTGRADNAARLAGIPGLVTPTILTLPRDQIKTSVLSEHGITFPFLIRSPGYHTGMFFMKVDNENELTAALPSLPGHELMVLEYLDTRKADGKYRKYRVMMIDGKLYPLHAAISHDWKVHYFSADMANNPEHRAEEEAFLNDMPATLGPRAMQGLEQLCATLGLDYGGADFGLNDKGNIVLFEANATMFADVPGVGEQWDYRRAAAQRIVDAIRTMLINRAQKDLITMRLSCPA